MSDLVDTLNTYAELGTGLVMEFEAHDPDEVLERQLLYIIRVGEDTLLLEIGQGGAGLHVTVRTFMEGESVTPDVIVVLNAVVVRVPS
jgi:hypothetical protein